MSNLAVLGCLWGDEAKAKIVDFLGEQADVVVRFQGGSNAGHTIYLDGKKYVFHSIPSGILYPNTKCVIAAGLVLDLEAIKTEIEELVKKGIDLGHRIFLDERAGIVLPLHKELDATRERDRSLNKIGTTKRGIGPAYSDLSARVCLRLQDLRHPDWLKERLINLYRYHKQERTEDEIQTEISGLLDLWKFFRPMVCATDDLLNIWNSEGLNILFEGAQGTLLDLTYGTYPYVTSSHTMSGGIAVGSAFPLRKIDRIIGVFKAYCTRVGAGSFPTELHDSMGDLIRQKGNEYGSTTGRPRRCGWFDAVAGKYSARINDLDAIAVTLLDVLSGFEELKICTAYWYQNERMETFPTDPMILKDAVPEYLTLKGWDKDISQAKRISQLPKAAIDYLDVIQDLIGLPLEIVSVGKERSQTIVIKK